MGNFIKDAPSILLAISLLFTAGLSQELKNATNCVTGAILPNTFNANKFYVCYNGELWSQNCPTGMQFDPAERFCKASNIGGKNCDGIPNGGFVASENNPQQYYVCVNGELIPQMCRDGQLFNPALGYCTQSQWSSTASPRPTPSITPPKLDCDPFSQGAFVPDLVDPTKYYVCVLGLLRPQYCSAGKVFNSSTLQCENGSTTPKPGMCGEYDPDYKLPLFNQAGKYYLVCTLGVFLVQSCSEVQKHNESFCKESAESCPSAPITSSCPSGQIEYPPPTGCKNPFGNEITGNFAANPKDPASYYQRDPFQLVNCPPGQHFFQALDTNNPPCAKVPLWTPSAGVTYEVSPLFLNPMEPPSPVPGYSRYYILYNNGSSIVQRCPDDFIVYKGVCTKLTRTSRSLILANENSCTNENQGKYFPVENDCRKFLLCFNSQLIEHACPSGQYYDSTQNVCTTNEGQCTTTSISSEENLLRSKRSLHYGRNADNTECFGKHGVFTPDPFDCRRFYACINGWKIGQSCQEGEAYDPQTQSCTIDYQEICPTHSAINVFLDKLENTNADTENTEQTKADVNCAGHELGEFLANPNDCTSYYVCSNGFAIPKQCPAEHYFDTVKRICRPSDGSCEGDHELTDSAEQPIYLAPTDDTSICTGKHGIIVPDPEDCTSFFLCIYGRAHHDRCYEGEYFDSQQRHCTINHGVCTFATKIEQSTETSEAAEEKLVNNACNGYFDGTHLPNPESCNRFFVCIDGIPIPEQCGENEFFDSVHGFCRENQDGADSCSNMLSEKSVCYGKHGIHVEHQDDCRKYYLCVNGQALVHDCNVNEYFNTRLGSCILDVDNKCSGIEKIEEIVKEDVSQHQVEEESKPVSSIVENSNEMHQYVEYENYIGKPVYQKPALHVYKPDAPKKRLPKCTRGMREYMFYPNVNDDCRTFYECINGKPFLHSCPIGFVYNAVLNICDLPDFVECTHTMNIKDTRDTSCEGAISGVRYANFEDGCKSFYVCSHGNAIHTYCGEGLLYNPIMGVCDWAANIQCLSAYGKERKRS